MTVFRVTDQKQEFSILMELAPLQSSTAKGKCAIFHDKQMGGPSPFERTGSELEARLWQAVQEAFGVEVDEHRNYLLPNGSLRHFKVSDTQTTAQNSAWMDVTRGGTPRIEGFTVAMLGREAESATGIIPAPSTNVHDTKPGRQPPPTWMRGKDPESE
jgi:hypothetical protein